MERIDFDPPEPSRVDLDVRISVHWKDSTSKSNVKLEAHLGDIRIAECLAHRIAEYTDEEKAKDWFCISWLGVGESFRGKHLGKHLLERTMLEMRQAGYRHAIISTAVNNHLAFVFYTNFGFEISDWTFGLSKVLGR
jgi:GNAT superfamily N-acetyltransferase